LQCREFRFQERLPDFQMEGHIMFVANNCLWLYGGINEIGELPGIFRRIDLATRSSSRRAYCPATDPKPRELPANCVHDGALYMLGGRGLGGTFSDFWSFDLATAQWHRLEGDAKRSLSGSHCAIAGFRDFVYAVEGSTSFLVRRYHTEKKQWEIRAEVENPIWDPSVFALDERSLLVIGWRDGMQVFRITVDERGRGDHIELIDTVGLPPPRRQWGTAVKFNENIFLVFGDEKEPEPFALDVAKGRWFIPKSVGVVGRDYYALCGAEGKIWMHGGTAKMQRQDALYTIAAAPPEGTGAKPRGRPA
jgi:hypothetical protein